MMDTVGKWVLITGVSEGSLGDALVREFLHRQVNVIATGITKSQLEHLESAGSVRLEKLQLDVVSTSSISAAVEEAQHITDGKLSILVNNAGYGYMMPLIDANIESIKRNFDVNVFGLLAVTQAFFPMLRAAKGILVNQASIAGLPGVCQPYIGAYSASKSAVVDLSNTLRVELAPFDIKVVTLITGDVKTHFWDNVQGAHVGIPDSSPYQPIKRKVEAVMKGENHPPGQHSAQQWAKAVVDDLLKQNPPSFVHKGNLATLMSILSWLFPTWLFDWLFTRGSDLGKLKAMLNSRQGKKTQ